MKKIMTAIIISTFVIALGGMTTFAAGRGRQVSQPAGQNARPAAENAGYVGAGTGQYFIDEDGDGICDYLEENGGTEYSYRNADNRAETCPYNGSSTPEYRRHTNGAGGSGQYGHRGYRGGFR